MPAPGQSVLQRSLRWLHGFEDLLLAGLLLGMILLAASQILLRNFFDWNFSWGDPLVRVLVLWVGMLGAMAASRRTDKGGNRHISIDVLSPLLAGRRLHAANCLTALFTAAVCGLLAWHCGRFVYEEMQFGATGVGGVPLWWFQSVLPLGFGVMTLRFALSALLGAANVINPPQEAN